MPISNAAFIRSTAALLLVGLATLVVIVAATLWLAVRAEDYSVEVSRGRLTRSRLVEVRNLLQDLETGQRGYLLTRTDSYLDPYDRARTTLASRLAELGSVYATDPLKDDVARLEGVARDKMAELAETVALARSERMNEALRIVRTDRGKALMDEARVLLGRLLSDTDARIVNRMNAQDSALTALKWLVILGSVVILTVVGGSVVIALRYTGELLAARSELAALNRGLEQRVADRTRALARANDEIQRFAYVVSHDLRSPLVNVIGFTAELEELEPELFPGGTTGGDAGRDLASEFREATSFIRASVTKMDGLISAILRVAREGGRQLRPERVALREIAEAAVASVRHRVDQAGGRVAIGTDLPTIRSDRLAVEQIVMNLIDNAVKYSDASRAPAISIDGETESDGKVALRVSDNGRGIAAADQETVFDLFKRVGSQQVSGEGIGLAHIRTLARRLGGDVEVSSELGRGSTFTVRLAPLEATPA